MKKGTKSREAWRKLVKWHLKKANRDVHPTGYPSYKRPWKKAVKNKDD